MLTFSNYDKNPIKGAERPDYFLKISLNLNRVLVLWVLLGMALGTAGGVGPATAGAILSLPYPLPQTFWGWSCKGHPTKEKKMDFARMLRLIENGFCFVSKGQNLQNLLSLVAESEIRVSVRSVRGGWMVEIA